MRTPGPAAFDPVAQSAGAARVYASAVLADLGLEELADDVRTVVSELATNAVLHARTPFTVSVTRDEGRLRVVVRDRSAVAPRLSRPRGGDATTGRGLRMVALLATDWGVDVLADGKAVWAALPLAPAPDATYEATTTASGADLDALLEELGESAPGTGEQAR